MNLGRLVWRNLVFHWRGNGAVFLGVVVGTAVLTGALLVGDSLRGNLRDLAQEQLGWVDQALVSGRFLRASLATDLPAERTAAVIYFLQGSVTTPGADTDSHEKIRRRAGGVSILGVDDRFWPVLPGGRQFWQGSETDAIINQALASTLEAREGDPITLHLQKVSAVPRETLLGRRDASEVLDQVTVRVKQVIPNEGAGKFSLNPSPQTSRNVFVPIQLLQARLKLAGRANAFLLAGAKSEFQESLRSHLTLEDWGLVVRTPQTRTRDLFDKLDRNHDGKLETSEWRRGLSISMAKLADANGDGILDKNEVLAYYLRHHPYISLESRQMILEPGAVQAALEAAKKSRLRAAPTLVYLANSISKETQPAGASKTWHASSGDAGGSIPYSVVAALDPSLPSPLGQFLPKDVSQLHDGDIVLADWKESPLAARPGDSIELRYFEPELEGGLHEVVRSFKLKGFVPLKGPANDPDLTPEFPGITDKLGIRDWNPPFPYDNRRVQRRDERYWEDYRTTPKAYITLADGQKLWGSRFGNLTSIRLEPAQSDGTDLAKVAREFENSLLAELRPENAEMVFDNVRERALKGSSGSSNFGWLFVGFSSFLIAAALLLVGLLFRLNIERRAQEIGLLFAAGFRRRTVRLLLLAEGSILAIAGGIFGLAAALVYARLMLGLLRRWWPGGLEQSFLRLHVSAASLAIGFGLALVVSLLTIYWAVRVLGWLTPSALLQGSALEAATPVVVKRAGRVNRWIIAGSILGAIPCLGGGWFLSDQETQASTFLLGGALLLTAGLAAVRYRMRLTWHAKAIRLGPGAILHLGIRNAARNPIRSLLTAGLLASAAFLIIAVGSFYRDPGRRFLDLHGGSGGLALLGECDVPIYQDLNSDKGKDELNFSDRAVQELNGITFYPFRVHHGDDASCLNLYQPKSPRILGVSRTLVDRGGFEFKAVKTHADDNHANPWLLLNETQADGAIPVMGEANSMEWILGKHLGDEMQVQDGEGKPARLRLVGLLQDSVFQSSLLVSEANFLKLYPRQEGYQFFLVDVPLERMTTVEHLLESTLAGHGFATTPSLDRLASFLAVENTYLSTFQALGGFGLLLGAMGLAVVLLRGIWERRGELALLRALGFRQRVLRRLILAENGYLLVLGLAVGTGAALLSVAPHVAAGGGQLPWARLILVLILVLVVGLSAAAVATATALRAPLLAALRRE
jgi:ABC-type lipoprotein release transport system permease subunit